MSNYLTKKRNELLKKIDSIKKWILSNNHNNETEKCISILNELKREVEINATKKFGLLWDKEIEPEEVVRICESNIPILELQSDKKIINGKINNILIEGDNFHSLSALNFVLQGAIDIIYIDPPYNTGNGDFTYNDKFVNEDDGFRHSKWLSMMQKRLNLSRQLLKDSGVIFISIDDNEFFNLKLLCDQIFGERNYLGTVYWKSNPNGRGDSKYLGTIFEYVLCYKKKDVAFNYEPQDLAQFKLRDEKGPYAEQILHSKLSYSVGMDYSIIAPDGTEIYAGNVTKEEWLKRRADRTVKKAMTWRFGEERFKAELAKGEIVFRKKADGWKVYRKRRPVVGGSAPYKNLYEEEGTRHGSNQIKNIFNYTPFDHPKPVGLIKFLISLIKVKNPIVLDFFAGSGTTGQAVLELNQQDGGERIFILGTNNENQICQNITYPRLKTVITGIRPDGSKYSDGIPANLYYFKTTFIEDHVNSEQVKYNLVEKVDSLLCIAENIFDEVERNEYSSHFVRENRHLFIYSDYYSVAKFTEFKNRVLRAQGEKIVYIYSSDNSVDETLFEGTDIQVKPIPSKIYEIYREIVEGIKRGE
jgi:adenine-specific DNA-methyltransferase